MRKIASFCVACLFSGASLATSNFSSSDGILLIPDVNVNGSTFYDTVTLKLNLSNGTFSVLNAQPKSKTVFDTPIGSYTAEGYTVDLLGCASTGTNEITCYSRVVNNKAKRTLYANGGSFTGGGNTLASILFDDLNNAYKAASVTFSTESSSNYVSAAIAQGVPANVTLVFKGINIKAKAISSFQPAFLTTGDANVHFEANFRNIKF
ncbi:MAG: hypothetical protein NTV00_14690 [Methylococcales bacterium]|nr:hypothetical protein [Methylococcales bacterium]